ncbi:MAG TPA: hypothetical protein VGL48_16740 [Acidimicrobiales bacterium]
MPVSEAVIASLPIPEQVLILVNNERLDRGLPAVSYMTAQLNSYAQQGANAGDDPGFPTTLSGGEPITWGGAIWAGGMTNVFEADYLWMYEDGWGGLASLTSNIACLIPLGSGCWGHRDIIVHPFSSCNGGGAPTISMGAAFSSSGYSGGSIAAVMMSTCGPPPSDVTLSWDQVAGSLMAGTLVVGVATNAGGQGYWEAEANGSVGNFDGAAAFGSMAGHVLNSPIVGIASTTGGDGYWLVAADGGIFSFGDAKFYGSTGSIRLNQPIVGIAATRDGGGYWLVAADGGIFSFGDATFHGSTGAIHLNQPIVGMAADPGTGGYWLVASDGGIFSFAAPFFGSTGALHLVKPIVGMAVSGGGRGYRFVAADGGVFSFGQAPFDGSMSGQSLASAIVGIATEITTNGYWLVAGNGDVFSFT